MSDPSLDPSQSPQPPPAPAPAPAPSHSPPAPAPTPSQSPPPPPPPPAPTPSDESDITHASNLTLLHGLSKPGPKRPALPAEIILQILSDPSRWIRSAKIVMEKRMSVTSAQRSHNVLFSPPLTLRSIGRLRKVVFTFKAKDQGWSSYIENHGTYENSWTWFEAMVGYRSAGPPPGLSGGRVSLSDGDGGSEEEDDGSEEDEPLEEDDGDGGGGHHHRLPNQQDPSTTTQWTAAATQMLQENRHAGRVSESYRHELEAGQGILANLNEGWEITLWACAQWPGWVNNVEEASMELWEVDDL